MAIPCFLSRADSPEVETWSTVMAGVMSLLALLIVTLILHQRRKSVKEAGLPPGPRGLPLLGYLPFLKPDLHRLFADLASTYGPVFSLRLGFRLCVVLSSPDSAREALQKNDVIFASHDVPTVASTSVFHGQDIVWLPYGPLWRTLRKVVVRELLSPPVIVNHYSVRRREVGHMMEEVRNRAGQQVNLRELVSDAAMNVTTTMLWGDKLAREGDALGKEFRSVLAEYVQTLGEANVADFFPALAWLDIQGLGRRARRLSEWMDRIFDSIIALRREEGAASDGAEAGKRNDFLHEIMELLETKDPRAPLTMMNVKGLLLDLVSGGTETIAVILEWAMAELLSNPSKMTKIKEEIAAIVGNDSTVEESHLPGVQLTAAVVKEVLRLHPPIPLLVPHRTSATCTIAGHRIPQGTTVFTNVWAIQRDAQSWKDPLAFEPERFLDQSDEQEYKGNIFRYLPFGAGRRICPGVFMGERTATFMLASLLHKLDWRVPQGSTLDMSEKFGFLLTKTEPLIAIPTPHEIGSGHHFSPSGSCNDL